MGLITSSSKRRITQKSGYSTRLFNFISPLPLDPHVACSRSRSLAPSDRSQGYNCFFFFIETGPPNSLALGGISRRTVEKTREPSVSFAPLPTRSVSAFDQTALSLPLPPPSRSIHASSQRRIVTRHERPLLLCLRTEWAGRSNNFLLYR